MSTYHHISAMELNLLNDYYSDEISFKPKSSVLSVRNPLNNFLERRTYKEIKEKQLYKSVSILHLHGIPGSGKSEMVCKLADEFPYMGNEEVVVKYEVDCLGANEDVQERLKHLLKEMAENNILNSSAACNSACSGLEKNRTQAFVKLLCDATVPILIIIQGPPKQHQMLLMDLVSSLKKTTSTKPIHVYVTSNSKSTLSNLSATEEYEVTGLTKEESLKMLRVSDTVSEMERKAAVKIFEDLSGSPLGLVAVETYCRTSRIRYSEYSQRSYNKFGPNHNHIFDAVIRLLNTKEGLLDQMETVAMFHNGFIPRYLLGKIMQRRRRIKDRDPVGIHSKNREESGKFISQLLDFNLCKEKDADQQLTVITLNQMVFSALQAHLLTDAQQYLYHLKEAILSISSVVNKDLRKPEDAVFMKRMRLHVQVVLQHVERQEEEIAKDFLMRMALIHLREVFGVINTDSDQKSAEESLELSARMIWKEVSSRSEIDVDFDLFLNKQDEPVEQCASRIIEACIAAGKRLKVKDVDEYVSLVMHLKKEDVEFLSKLSSSTLLSNCEETDFTHPWPISFHFLEELRSKKMFLGPKTHRRVFFIDRVISVMHSLGRLILYENRKVTVERWEKCSWMLALANALCIECKKRTGVGLLLYRVTKDSLVFAATDIIAKLRKANFTESQKKAILLRTLVVVKSAKEQVYEESDLLFANGLRKQRSQTDDSHGLPMLCVLIRGNAKLWRLCTPDQREELQQTADHYCEMLNKTAADTMDARNQSASCIVYCGKYLAAKGEYEQAAQYFLRAFKLTDVRNDNSNFFPWVCYNYARSVSVGKLQDYKLDALKKCDEGMRGAKMIEDGLLTKLKEQQVFLSN